MEQPIWERILGDFRQSLIQSVSVDIGKAPVEAFRFEDFRSGKTADILTEFKRTSAYSLQYIEKRVNQNIGTAYEEKFGKLRSDLCSEFGFSYAQVQIEDTSLVFPEGNTRYRMRLIPPRLERSRIQCGSIMTGLTARRR
jgi:hypothetical protein